MRRLNIFPIEDNDNLVWKQQQSNLTKASPALDIFTDFSKVAPMVIESDCLAIEIREIMKKEHVRMKIVVDTHNLFLGLLPLSCLTDENINRKIINDGFTKDNLYVKHCMLEKSQLQSLDYHELTTATIGDVIESLKHIGNRHCIVVEHDNHHIRGIISAGDISRALNIEVSTGTGSTFLDVFNAIPH